ncbi:MAG: hypothetical protein ACLGPL_03450 [Acidobacteriota bacterium]
MAFQRFVGRQEKSFTPKVSILARGLIEFNAGAMRKFALSRFSYAVLYYDPETNQVGVQFTNNSGERGARKVIKKPNGLVVPASAFLAENGLMKSQSLMYDLTYSGEHDMYIIQLPIETEVDIPGGRDKGDGEELIA